jgi:hypothetical protein
MFVYSHPQKRLLAGRRHVVGSGLVDWISSAVRTAAKVISTNKDTIKGVAGVVGKVAKAGATTASAVKQIVDTVKSKKHIPPQLKKDLSGKSVEVLKQLAVSGAPAAGAAELRSASAANINSRIAGAGLRTLRN